MPHPFFQREGPDIYCEIPLTFGQAALGTEIEVPTLDGSAAKIKVPAGTQPGGSFRLRGKGIQELGARTKGDLVVVVNLSVPTDLSQRQKELIRELEELGEGQESLTDKIRNMFAGRS